MTNDLKFSGDMPVVINYNGSPDDIYAPVRTSSCDINIVSTSILDDLYTAKKDDICVRIKKGNTTIWEGYKMPNTYSQEVSLNLDNITMTCIDPVSILKFVTIDKLMDKPNIITYGELIGKALAYVMIDANSLWVERTVSYGGAYSGTNGLLDLSIQVANFWDEAGEPSTVYEVIEEMLRPFCLTLVYYNNTYQIYNSNKISGTRYFDKYTISANGTLTRTSTNQSETRTTGLYQFSTDDWKSNNVQTPTIEINSTYDKVTGIASTSIPNYSRMVFDVVDYTQRNKYSYEDFNVQRNKSKGYVPSGSSASLDTTNRWYYIWNGVYCDANYGLTDAGLYTNWYNNCNKAYYYLTGNAGHPDNWGACLNFYGGANNPTATGKTQSSEKSVKVNKKITAYAADNGTPLEFLEVIDLNWAFNGNVTYQDSVNMAPEIDKADKTDAKYGVSKNQGASRVVYHQEYSNVLMDSNNQQTIDLDISQSYSRTGIDLDIDILNNNTCSDAHFASYDNMWYMTDATVNYFPKMWDSASVVVDKNYFSKYATPYTLTRPSRVQPVWDKRRVDLYITLTNNSVLQFNGKEWVSDLHPEIANSFYLMRMVNGEQLFNQEHRYNIIETADGERYSLGEEPYVYYLDEVGGVTEREMSGGSTVTYEIYRDESKDWYKWIDKCSDGSMSVLLPEVDDMGATIVMEIYNSYLLGTTGGNTTEIRNTQENIWFKDPDNLVRNYYTTVLFLPHNVTYVKAEHLNLDISVSVPESNLGQMFDESDIKYELNSNQDYVEEFEGPSFLVNTYNPLVASSFSYLVFGNTIADPNLFIVGGQTVRPEAYTVQAYFNWLSKIRKIYTKTLVPEMNRTRPFANVRCYITSPEVGSNELLVVSDRWDVKTNRHTVAAVEDQDLEVGTVGTVDVIEIPRMARADRYNLPTAKKK